MLGKVSDCINVKYHWGQIREKATEGKGEE